MRRCFERGQNAGTPLSGSVRLRFVIAADGSVSSASVVGSSGNGAVDACLIREARRLRFGPGPGGVTVVYPFLLSSAASRPPLSLLFAQTLPLAIAAVGELERRDAHRRGHCSDASRLPLAARAELWRERLEREGFVAAQVRAIRDCEARTWRARRALLGVVLDHAGSVQAMLAVYRLLSSAAARGHARAVILRRVATPMDLRAIRHAFGEGADVTIDWALIEQILENAPTGARRIRALRRLVMQYPRNSELKLRLLEELDDAGQLAAANRLAAELRSDPLSDPGVRTALGERLVQSGRADEARRAFSEIVEFAPLDELARRRLGDLYRAHGWHEAAYRQYQTLSELRPDDESVWLLLAMAAAGADRIDEALRLELRVSQTSQPGNARGIARTALHWSSVRFARLRHEAQSDERRAQLRRRMRRTGVLANMVDLRVSLTFSHPDAQLGLWLASDGRPFARATEITPQHGIEVYERVEANPEPLHIEVRRPSDNDGPIEAELLVVWREGQPDEQIRIVPMSFDETQHTYAWTVEGLDFEAAESINQR